MYVNCVSINNWGEKLKKGKKRNQSMIPAQALLFNIVLETVVGKWAHYMWQNKVDSLPLTIY